MNDEQKSILGDMIKDLSTKPVDELKTFYTVTWLIGFISAAAGIGVLVMSMFLPGMIMFIAAGFVLLIAGNVSITTDVIKHAIKGLIKAKDEG